MNIECDWALRIIRAQNGYVLVYDEPLDDGVVRRQRELIVAGEREDEDDEMVHLLWAVRDFFDSNAKVMVSRDPGC